MSIAMDVKENENGTTDLTIRGLDAIWENYLKGLDCSEESPEAILSMKSLFYDGAASMMSIFDAARHIAALDPIQGPALSAKIIVSQKVCLEEFHKEVESYIEKMPDEPEATSEQG